MHELDSITIKGFKSIAAIEKLKLGAINVLIGPNGSGKSNFIGVFAFLKAIRDGQLQEYVARAGGADKILHFGARETPTLTIHIYFQGEKDQYQIMLAATEADQLFPSSEIVSFWGDVQIPPFSIELNPRGGEASIGAASGGNANFAVDEPELGLHPSAITLLAALVKQAAQTTQVILSTQSPILLDHFQPEDVLVADRVDGGTQLTRLDADSLAVWLEEYSLGQLWEKNELGGRPAVEGVYG